MSTPNAKVKKTFQPLFYDHLEQHEFQVRDGLAMMFLQNRLADLGFRLGEPIIQSCVTPDYKGKVPVFPASAATIDNSGQVHSDLLVTSTRPPLDDLPPPSDWLTAPKGGAPKRGVLNPSGTVLEQQLFQSLRTIFQYEARKNITLQDKIASELRPDYESRKSIHFSQFLDGRKRRTANRMAAYKEFDDGARVPRDTTCWYLVRVFLPKLNIPVVCLFGLSGSDTLAAAKAICSKSELGKLFDDVVTSSGEHWRLIMIEASKTAASDVEFQTKIIANATGSH